MDSAVSHVANVSTCSSWCLDLMSADSTVSMSETNAWHVNSDQETGFMLTCTCLHLAVCMNPFDWEESYNKTDLTTLLQPGTILYILKSKMNLTQTCSTCPPIEGIQRISDYKDNEIL